MRAFLFVKIRLKRIQFITNIDGVMTVIDLTHFENDVIYFDYYPALFALYLILYPSLYFARIKYYDLKKSIFVIDEKYPYLYR